jgi:exosortase A-associated hydrolase 1
VTREEALAFACGGDTLVGILHRPARPARVGVVVVVGGPQYRAGSHRQFTLLARHLAAAGFAVLRFDCRGMGDSSGEFPGFEAIGPDIAAAVDCLARSVPGVESVALWGLCDAASAALCYGHGDARVAGLVLANPWVRSETTLARAQLRHYYLRRLLSPDFWRKLLSGRFRPAAAAAGLADNLRSGAGSGPAGGFVERMRAGLAAFDGPVLLFLSGNDLTAAEFTAVAAGPDWRPLLEQPRVTRRLLPGATHTFSSAAWRDEVARGTLEWLRGLPAAGSSR